MKFTEYELGELGEIITGKTPKKSNSLYYDSNEVLFIKPDDLTVNNIKYISTANEFVSSQGAATGRIVGKGTVLITCIGIIGKIGIVDTDKAIFNQQINAIIPNENLIFGKYLAYVLHSMQKILQDKANAPIVPIINKSDFSKIKVRVPDLDYQKKVIEVLDESQKLINKRQSQIAALDELTQSMFLEMFGDPQFNKKEFPIVTIKEITQLIKGITYKPEQVSDTGTIVLRSSNIKGKDFDVQDLVRINKTVDERFLVKVDDILMCNRNGSARLVGKVAKIPAYPEEMTFGTFMTIIRSEYHNYLYNFFQTDAFRRQIQMQTSVAINQISLPLLESVKLPLPPLKLQEQFDRVTKEIGLNRMMLKDSLKELETLYNALLQKAFKGELFQE